jgi:hypothetical protein
MVGSMSRWGSGSQTLPNCENEGVTESTILLDVLR